MSSQVDAGEALEFYAGGIEFFRAVLEQHRCRKCRQRGFGLLVVGEVRVWWICPHCNTCNHKPAQLRLLREQQTSGAI